MIKISALSSSPELKCHLKNQREMNRFRPLLVILLFLSSIILPCFPQDSSEEILHPSLDLAEAMISEGRPEDALKVLEQLEDRSSSPEKEAKFYLLKACVFLKLDDRDRCEEAVREIFSRGLSKQVQVDSLEKDLQVIFSKIKAEYWFSLNESGADEDRDREYQRVIEQGKQKPVKKRVLPKLILGTALLGVVAGAILVFTSGSDYGNDDENMGTLKFENGLGWRVDIEIAGIERPVPSASGSGRVPLNLCYIDLLPGTHILKVTSTSPFTGETSVYTYSIEIVKGRETYFLFRP